MGSAKKKLPCLVALDDLTTKDVIIVKNMKTVTLVYKYGLTNLDFTLGLTENVDKDGNIINSKLLPRTLRVKDKAVDTSTDGEIVDFIFCKDADEKRYTNMTFGDTKKKIPYAIKDLVDISFFTQGGEKQAIPPDIRESDTLNPENNT